MRQEFECQEPDCDEKIIYEYQSVDSPETTKLPRILEDAEVYLSCDEYVL